MDDHLDRPDRRCRSVGPTWRRAADLLSLEVALDEAQGYMPAADGNVLPGQRRKAAGRQADLDALTDA